MQKIKLILTPLLMLLFLGCESKTNSGINKIHWDLTDQDGDKIANGVYLYKIILRDQDKVEHYTQKLAIVR